MISLKKQNQKGFTLVELLVTITIFVILTGIVLWNQSKFNSTILFTNLAYDTALTVRQAQTYGMNIKEFGKDNFVPYGVHFDKSAPKSFILFADLTYDATLETNTGIYEASGLDPMDLSRCQAEKGCVNRYNIKSGNYIKDICKGDVGLGVKVCTAGDSISKLDVVFKRPDPDAHMKTATGDTEYIVATIILGNPDGSVKKVRVRNNGLIEIVN